MSATSRSVKGVSIANNLNGGNTNNSNNTNNNNNINNNNNALSGE